MELHRWVIFSWAFPWLFLLILPRDPYIGLYVVGFPFEVAKRITFEDQITNINMNIPQEVVEKWLYLTVSISKVNHLLDQNDTQHLKLDKLSVGQEFVEEWCSLIYHLVLIIFMSKFSILVCMMIIQSKSTSFGVTSFLMTWWWLFVCASTKKILPLRVKIWNL